MTSVLKKHLRNIPLMARAEASDQIVKKTALYRRFIIL
jgi:hypothetical protein